MATTESYFAYLHRTTVQARKHGGDYEMSGDEWSRAMEAFFAAFYDTATRLFVSRNRLAGTIGDDQTLPETMGEMVRIDEQDRDLLHGSRLLLAPNSDDAPLVASA